MKRRRRDENMTVLWLLLLPFTIWAAHFLAVYVVAAIWCAKSPGTGAAMSNVRWITVAITAVALAALAASAWYGHRHSRSRAATPADDASPAREQLRFVWAVLVMMALLSALAVIYVGGVPFFFGDCR